jgi:hypothetical protein
MGKILGLLSAVLLVVFEPISSGWRFPAPRVLSYPIAPLSVLLIIMVVDLVIVFILFTFPTERPPRAQQ